MTFSIICNFYGGLGNQMFQLACAIALSEKFDGTIYASTDMLYQSPIHNRFSLESAYNVDIPHFSRALPRSFFPYLPALPRKIISKLPSFLTPHGFLTEHNINQFKIHPSRSQSVYLHGYWQNEDFFSSSSDTIRRILLVHNMLSLVVSIALLNLYLHVNLLHCMFEGVTISLTMQLQSFMDFVVLIII